MDNYVRVYENVLSDTLCDEIIKFFEENKKQQVTQKEGSMSLLKFLLQKILIGLVITNNYPES